MRDRQLPLIQPRWKVRGPTPSGDIVDWEVFYSIRWAKKYVAEMGDGFFIVPVHKVC